jgi:hypothetical protein
MPESPVTPPNLATLLYFRSGERGGTQTVAQFQQSYGFEPGGVNAYYGLNNSAVAQWQMTGTALREQHRGLFDDMLATLLASPRLGKTIDLGLWPFQTPEPFGFVRNHLSLVNTLAAELNDYQTRARTRGKHLDVVVRFASEMNDPAKTGMPWGRNKPVDPEQQAAYRETFALVRAVFREKAPWVRFAFAPAVRADIRGDRLAMIADYWPGDGLADVVSCTWYVGRETDFDRAVENLRAYVAAWKPKGLPFALNEIGGINEDQGNDAMLQRMLGVIGDLDVKFDYATLFLGSKWGKDATLQFLRAPEAGQKLEG